MLLKRKSVIALCLCFAVVQGCRHENDSASQLVLTHEVSPQPPRVGPVTITLKVTNASGKPATGLHIQLEANMSHAGMTPILFFAKENEPGRYSSTIELPMAGDWFVLVYMTLPDGGKVKREFEIKGVSL